MKTKTVILVLIAIISTFALFSCFSKDENEVWEDEPIKKVYLSAYHQNDYCIETEFLPEEENSHIYVAIRPHLYDFDGYYTERNGKGMKAFDTEGVPTQEFREYCLQNLEKHIAVYANATPKPCTITFINPYGEAPEPMTVDCDTYVNLPTEVYRTGYRFQGWDENENAYRGDEGMFTYATEYTLYAVFDPIKVDIICEDMPTSIMRHTVEYDADYTFRYADKYGYNFVGYFSEENGQGTQYTDSTGKSLASWNVEITDYSTVHVYPYFVPATNYKIYIPNDYLKPYITVTYVDFYGIGSGRNLEKTYSNSRPIEFITPQKLPTGHVFDGWYLDSSLTKKFSYDEPVSDDLILYPRTYKPSAYLASFGYRQIDSDQTYKYELSTDKVREPSFMCTYSGYLTVTLSVEGPDDKMVSFSLSRSNGGSTMYRLYNGETATWRIKVNEEDIIKIYMDGYAADNETQTVTVSFTELGLKGKTAEVDIPEVFTVGVTQGNRYSLPKNTESIYTFKGYYTEANGQGIRLTDEDGNSIGDYEFDRDIYAYGYYVIEE